MVEGSCPVTPHCLSSAAGEGLTVVAVVVFLVRTPDGLLFVMIHYDHQDEDEFALLMLLSRLQIWHHRHSDPHWEQ